MSWQKLLVSIIFINVVVLSTLMVLLANSNRSIDQLWNTVGGLNDPSGNKNMLPPGTIIKEGNFRSVVVDSWASEAYESIIVYGMNMFGDIFWETEFNATESSSNMSSWLTTPRIIRSSSTVTASQYVYANSWHSCRCYQSKQADPILRILAWISTPLTTTRKKYSNNNYRYRIVPSDTTKSWFAVSNIGLSYGPLPLIFVPRSPDTPFSAPVMLDGHLGCWYLSGQFATYTFYQDDPSNSPRACVLSCWTSGNIAVLVQTTLCYCGTTYPNYVPTIGASNCYIACPGNASAQCGGFANTYGNVYHVQGGTLPGTLAPTVLYSNTYSSVNGTIQIDVNDVTVVAAGHPIIFTSLKLSVPVPPQPDYTVSYSNNTCSQAAGNMKPVSQDGTTPSVFSANGVEATVDILLARCVQIHLTIATPLVNVTLLGPTVSSTYVSVPALVIQGKKRVPETTTTSTSSTTTTPTTTSTAAATTESTTTTTSTTVATSTATTTLPPTTTTLPPSTAATTTSPPSTTTTTSPPSTTTSPPSTVTTTTTTGAAATTTSTTSTTQPASTTTQVSATQTTTISSAAAVSSPSTAPSTTTQTPCFCSCKYNLTQLNLTTEELQEKILEIQRHLAVNVSELSATIRKLTSAEDNRVSAVSIGYLGLGILVAIIGSIIFIDSGMLFRDCKLLYHNLKHGLCRRSVQVPTG